MRHLIPIIAGATGSGKTNVGTELCTIIGGEIVSADSRQVYRYLDIGANKSGVWDPDRGVRVFNGIPQHLTDLIDPSEHFSAGAFVEQARRACADIITRGSRPVIVGGTGLYIKAFTDGLAPLPPADPRLRAELTAMARTQGPDYLYEQLRAVDPGAAEKHRGNPQRLLRALEVYRLTGRPVSHLQTATTPPTAYDFIPFSLEWPREELYALLDARTESMFLSGLLDETRAVLNRGFSANDPGFEGIGYREAVQCLSGAISREEANTRTQQLTRNYAKRQVTWFRKDARIHRIPCTRTTFNPATIAREIASRL